MKEAAPNVRLYESSSKLIQKKRIISQVTNALESVIPESSSAEVKKLDEHLRRITHYIVQQQQPDAEILRHDSTTVATIIDMGNTKNSNLNLTLCNSIHDAIVVLEKEKASSQKRLIFRDADIGQHYVFADISFKSDAPVSVILFESADVGGITK